MTEKVTAQYARSKEDREAESKAIEEIADWMHEQVGYKKAIDEMKK